MRVATQSLPGLVCCPPCPTGVPRLLWPMLSRKPWLLQVPALHALHCLVASASWSLGLPESLPVHPAERSDCVRLWGRWFPSGGFFRGAPAFVGSRRRDFHVSQVHGSPPGPGPRGSVCRPSPTCLELGAGRPEARLGSLISQNDWGIPFWLELSGRASVAPSARAVGPESRLGAPTAAVAK